MNQGLKLGLLTGLASIVYSFILYLTGLSHVRALGWITILIFLVGIVVAQLSAGKNQQTFGYGKAFLVGLVVVIVAGLLANVYGYINLSYIDTGLMDFILEQQAMSLQAQGLSEEQIDARLSGPMATPGFFAILGFIMGTLMGTVLSLITAAFTRKKAQA